MREPGRTLIPERTLSVDGEGCHGRSRSHGPAGARDSGRDGARAAPADRDSPRARRHRAAARVRPGAARHPTAARDRAPPLPAGDALLGEPHDVAARRPPVTALHRPDVDPPRRRVGVRRGVDRDPLRGAFPHGAPPRRRRGASGCHSGRRPRAPAPGAHVHEAQGREPDERRNGARALRDRPLARPRRERHRVVDHGHDRPLVPRRGRSRHRGGGVGLPGAAAREPRARHQHHAPARAVRRLPPRRAHRRLGRSGGRLRRTHRGLVARAHHDRDVAPPGAVGVAVRRLPAQRGVVRPHRARSAVRRARRAGPAARHPRRDHARNVGRADRRPVSIPDVVRAILATAGSPALRPSPRTRGQHVRRFPRRRLARDRALGAGIHRGHRRTHRPQHRRVRDRRGDPPEPARTGAAPARDRALGASAAG